MLITSIPSRQLMHHPGWFIVGASLVLNGSLWFLAWQFSKQHPEAAILHYNVDVGIDFIGTGKQITILPAIGSALLGMNGLLGLVLKNTDRRAAWILWNAIPVMQVIMLGVYFLLWRINQ